MPFENPLLAKLFEGVLEGRSVNFENEMLPRDEVLKAIDLLPIPLSRRQREAVFRAWTNEVSYIQGPPGTGKSHTITAIMLVALFLKKRVLLVSHKKPAIDVVFEKLTKDSPGRPAMLGAGSVIYASNDSAQRQRMRGELQLWLARCGTLHGRSELEEFRRKRAHHRGHVEKLRADVEQLETKIKKALDWERDYYERQEELHKNRKSYGDRFGGANLTSLKLSASANPIRALEVLKNVEQLLDDGVYATNGQVPRQKILHLRRFFSACANQFFANTSSFLPNLATVNYLREHLELTADSQRASESLAKVIPDFLSQARKILRRKRDDLQKQRLELAKAQVAAHVVGHLIESEDDVQKFRGMVHNTNATLIAQKMQVINFPQLIETFPLWVGQMRHLGEFLPFQPNLFDLVIVDEASQVNIAEIIPAFYRGSRICVVGDDKQLGGCNPIGIAGKLRRRSCDDGAWPARILPLNRSAFRESQACENRRGGWRSRVLNQDGGGQDAAQVVGRKFQNRYLTACEVLLVTNVLIRRDEQGEFSLSQPQQVTVLGAAPAAPLCGGAFMADEEFVHGPGNIRRAGCSCSRGEQRGFRPLQEAVSHRPRHRRETFEEFFQRVVAFEVVEERLDRDARAFEDGRAAKDVRVNGDEVAGVHGGKIGSFGRQSKSRIGQERHALIFHHHPAFAEDAGLLRGFADGRVAAEVTRLIFSRANRNSEAHSRRLLLLYVF